MVKGRQPCTSANPVLRAAPTPTESLYLRTFLLFLELSLAASSTTAQSIVSGEISGVVRDELAQPMHGLHVVLTEVRTGLQQDRETGAGGRFDFIFLPTGTYQLFAERLGYRPSRVESIPVRPNCSIPLPISLRPPLRRSMR